MSDANEPIKIDHRYVGVASILGNNGDTLPIASIHGPARDRIIEILESIDYIPKSEIMVDHGDFYVVSYSKTGTGYKLTRLNRHSKTVKTHNMFRLPRGIYPVYLVINDDKIYLILHKRKIGEVKRGIKSSTPVLMAYEVLRNVIADVWRVLQ